VPPPTSMKGMAKSALQALKGEKATVLIDKLAERLAFERTGTRPYETLIQKAQAINSADRSATVQGAGADLSRRAQSLSSALGLHREARRRSDG
jgi:hypothetical protein